MTTKMTLSALIALLLISCSSNTKQSTPIQSQEIIINDLERMPEEIEGCACYLSRDDDSFEQQKFVFASINTGTAFMMINKELIKFKLNSSTNEPFTFKTKDLIETYASDKYYLILDMHFEDSTRYDSWMFNGELTVKNKSGKTAKLHFVGACGC